MTSEQGCEGPSQAPSGPDGKLSHSSGRVTTATCGGDGNMQQPLEYVSIRIKKKEREFRVISNILALDFRKVPVISRQHA